MFEKESRRDVPAKEGLGDDVQERGGAGEPTGQPLSLQNRKIIEFDVLAEGARVVIVEFNRQRYHLRLTKSGRLVLTK